MQIYEELKARGLIAQVTDEEQIRELVNAGKATFYIGFDCTAGVEFYSNRSLRTQPGLSSSRCCPACCTS